jgi:glycosyltransferase involved in cell wall biosynthesis
MSGPEVLMPADIRFPLERANGVQIVKTAAALARAGARTTLLVRQSDPRPTAEVLALYGLAPLPGLTVERVRVLHRRGSFTLPRLAYLARAVRTAATARGRGAVVFTRDLQLADVLVRLPLRGPVVYEAHAVESLMYQERSALYGTTEVARKTKVARLFDREGRVWHRAGGFVTTTAGIRDTFAEAYGPRDAVRVIANGCDVPESRAFPGLAREDPPRVLYAGQLYPWKGVDVLVAAMAEVPAARLVILGGIAGEPDTERVRRLVETHGLAERTEMRGHVPQAAVEDELRRARVVVVPFLKSLMTEHHTSPLKAFEAMAVGRPLVVSDLPSSREFLRHEENALLVAPGDPKLLAAAVQRLLADPPLSERLARTAYAEAPLFSWDARARALCALFESLAR